MSVTVRIPTPLRKITKGLDVVEAGGADLSAILADLENNYPGIKDRIVDEAGEMRRFVNVFLNGEDVRFLDGLTTAVSEGDEISIVPAVAGGQVALAVQPLGDRDDQFVVDLDDAELVEFVCAQDRVHVGPVENCQIVDRVA